jgi:hypothetical protein
VVRDEDPATFACICATLLPKQLEIEDTRPQTSSASLDGVFTFDLTLELAFRGVDSVREHVVGIRHRVGGARA